MKDNYIFPNSPKNRYRASIYYRPALDFGTAESIGAMTFDDVKDRALAIIARRKAGWPVDDKHEIEVEIFENVAGYPAFDWQKVQSWKVGHSGGARKGAGRKTTTPKSSTISVRVVPSTDERFRKLRAAGVDFAHELDELVTHLCEVHKI